MKLLNVKPEIEAFDPSMILQAVTMQKTGKIAAPLTAGLLPTRAWRRA